MPWPSEPLGVIGTEWTGLAKGVLQMAAGDDGGVVKGGWMMDDGSEREVDS